MIKINLTIFLLRTLGTLIWSHASVGNSKPADPEVAEIFLKLKKIAGRLGLFSTSTTRSFFVNKVIVDLKKYFC